MTHDRSASLPAEFTRFIHWCRHDVLPLWAKAGVDRRRGGFYEQLHSDGSPDERAPRRVRVSARQIYAFSHASVLGWNDASALVSWGIDYLVSTTLRADGEPGFAHMLDADGHVCDWRRDLYDHAFHILALSWAYRATQDAQILSLAKETLAYVDEAMGAPDGGWYEGVPSRLPRRQNPHMHMVEALLALYEASGDSVYLRRADEIITLMAERFIDTKTGLLFEFFGQDLEPESPGIIEPGHMAEWCWLLHHRAELRQESSPELALQLGQHADRYGVFGDGFLLDSYTVSGAVRNKTRRLWSQTEWLKSMCARLSASPEELPEQAASLLVRLNDSYLNVTTKGLWIDQFDSDGTAMSKHVPASIVYHLVSAAAEAKRALTRMEGDAP